MLAEARVSEIAGEVARRSLRADRVERVEAASAIDSEGRDALRVVIYLHPGVAGGITGRNALDTLVTLRHALIDQGEERLPIVEYAESGECEEQEDESGDRKS